MSEKPLEILQQLHDCLMAEGVSFTFNKGEKIQIEQEEKENIVYFLESGCVFIYNEKKEWLLDVVDSAMLLGASGIVFKEYEGSCAVAVNACQGFWLTASRAKALLNQGSLWYELSIWLSYLAFYLKQRECDLLGSNNYCIVRSMLIRMQRIRPEVRQKLGVLEFIQQRSKISRTVIAEILCELRKGNYIEMNKGKLIQINRLPANY